VRRAASSSAAPQGRAPASSSGSACSGGTPRPARSQAARNSRSFQRGPSAHAPARKLCVDLRRIGSSVARHKLGADQGPQPRRRPPFFRPGRSPQRLFQTQGRSRRTASRKLCNTTSTKKRAIGHIGTRLTTVCLRKNEPRKAHIYYGARPALVGSADATSGLLGQQPVEQPDFGRADPQNLREKRVLLNVGLPFSTGCQTTTGPCFLYSCTYGRG
jgi:hypothetical protein